MTPRLEPARRVALRSRTYQVRVLLLNDTGEMGPPDELASSSPHYECGASLSPLRRRSNWRSAPDLHRVRDGLQPSASTASACGSLGRRTGVAPVPRPSRGRMLLLQQRLHRYGAGDWIRTSLSSFTKRVHYCSATPAKNRAARTDKPNSRAGSLD